MTRHVLDPANTDPRRSIPLVDSAARSLTEYSDLDRRDGLGGGRRG